NNSRDVAQTFFIFFSGSPPTETAKYVDPSYTTSHVTFFARNHKGDNITRIIQECKNFIADPKNDMYGKAVFKLAGGLIGLIVEDIRVNGDLELSIREALVTSGKAVSFTAVAMVGSTALWTFSNIRFNAVMGGLLAIWMFVSFIASETLLPVMISYFRPRFILREASKASRRPAVAAQAA